MISQRSLIITTTTFSGSKIEINLQRLQVFGYGKGHIIFANDDQNDPFYYKVIIVCIHNTHSIPTQLERLYEDIINENQSLSKYLMKKQQIMFNPEQKQLFRSQMNNNKEIKDKRVIPNTFQAFLAENLQRCFSNRHFFVQFKPKAPIPDFYSKDVIQDITNQSCKQFNQIVTKRPLQQRLRWFKKSCLCKKQKNKNMNPLQIFSVQTVKEPFIMGNLKVSEQIKHQFSLIQLKIINKNLFSALNESKIFEQILKLQLLYVYPSNFVQNKLNDYWDQLSDQQKFVKKLRQDLVNALKSKIDIKNTISELFSRQVIYDQVNLNNKIQQIIKFLISWTWRDISLMLRFNISQLLQIEDLNIQIIDYQLKESNKVKIIFEKDKEFLLNYVQFLKDQDLSSQ